MVPRLLRSFLGVLILCGCHRVTGGEAVPSLVGFTLPLEPSPTLRLAVRGVVEGVEAEVTFDPSSPLSVVSSGCGLASTLLSRVTVADAFGPDEVFPLTRVESLHLGAIRFRGFDAALASGKKCLVVLGEAELKELALEINPVARTVHFRPSQSPAQWNAEAQASGNEVLVLPMTKEPRFGWPLLSVRLRQGPAQFDGPMLLSLRESRSRVFEAAARASGLRPGLELLQGLTPVSGQKIPIELTQLRGFVWNELELAPGFGLRVGSIEVEPGEPVHTAQGLIGADVWGRFVTSYDVGSSVLVLRRPEVELSGARTLCKRAGHSSQENCFEVKAQPADGGIDVTAAIWRPLPLGARLSLDVEGGTGNCRIGLSFSPGDRGRSTSHHFPWNKLGAGNAACQEAFYGVTQVSPGLLEEGALPECPGVCAWAKDVLSGRLSCECQPGIRTGDGEAETQLLELFKHALENQRTLREEEPKDPD